MFFVLYPAGTKTGGEDMTENIIGYNIRSLRSERNMTQEQLAQKMYVKRQTLSNYEVGKRIPDIYELLTMADIFEITLDEFVGRTFQCAKCVRNSD
jgi:transcriptional regulator with XRE-family HTH domain